ncbi:MAG TPA: glycoside hydrolase family 18 protein, partial [Dehalococcoidia bacterium]|nr:glycoside hydrolase family 18 protein [Dehalococcoidia bacterium]
PAADGSIQLPDWGPFPEPALIERARAAGVRTILVVGTGDDATVTANFAALARDNATRRAFAAQLATLVAQHGYDGVDLDWEFPASAADRANLTRVVIVLRDALGAGKTLSISAPPTDDHGRWFDLPGMAPVIDWFGVMAYDLSGAGWSTIAEHNAPLYPGRSGEPSASGAVAYYLARGIPRRQILLGLPFFGQRFETATRLFQPLTPPTPGSAPDYREIAPLLGNGWTAQRDPAAQAPYLLRDGTPGLISYDDAGSIAAKCDYIQAQGLGGATVWSLGKDLLDGAQPLIESVRRLRAG